jgi:UDP-N-acetylmuramyl pentapeptide synthase
MKQFLINQLRRNAQKAIQQHQPRVVAITGSVGKTSAREAIAIALATTYQVRTAKKNYNNEIGVPLTILGEDSPGRSVWGWLSLLWRTRNMTTFPDVLVLEYGIDHPGDMHQLCELAEPEVAVVTGISPVHAEFFPDVEALAQEKATILQYVTKGGLAVLNGDDARVRAMREGVEEDVKRYGCAKENDVQAQNMRLSTRLDESFESGEVFAKTFADVTIGGQAIGTLELVNDIGYAPVMACLAALCVADHFDVPFSRVLRALSEKYHAMPGRLNPLPGIKGSLLIDDSYNAAPAAMQNGLDILKRFTPGEKTDRRIAVLGQMAELGQYTESEHRFIGMRVAETADVFVAVGEHMRIAIDAAIEAGMLKEQVHWFTTSTEAGRFLDGFVQKGDIVYIKGSQSTRMEKVVKDIMAEPLRASELLVRQEQKWLKN